MVNVLVTGGAGFIGSNFVRYALQTHPGPLVDAADYVVHFAAWRWRPIKERASDYKAYIEAQYHKR